MRRHEARWSSGVSNLWAVALVGLCLYALWRIGALHLVTTLSSGEVVPDTYATVDHPFHSSRAAVLFDSIQQGELLRWIGSHQGGYPVEFYPLGVAWLDVSLWALLGGMFPILAVHKLLVGLIFVLPALLYWLLARFDGLHPGFAFLATAFHLAIPGFWLSGGYEELVGWGLVTNVAGATFGAIGLVFLTHHVLNGHRLSSIGAIAFICLGAVSNPRSLFGIVAGAFAIIIWALVDGDSTAPRSVPRSQLRGLAVVGLICMALLAPLLIPLARYNDLYFFLHYQNYDSFRGYISALVQALTLPLLLLATAGLVAFLFTRLNRYRITATLALSSLLYGAFTLWVAAGGREFSFLAQLEAPRLMPLQRLMLIGVGTALIVVLLTKISVAMKGRRQQLVFAVAIIILGIGSIVGLTRSPQQSDVNLTAMYPVPAIGTQRFADFTAAVHIANEELPEGTSVFVIGNLDPWWHEQLWAAGVQPGIYYYDDWMWYWHSDQEGPYDPSVGYYQQNPAEALNPEYFQQHGIGVVMVTYMWVPYGEPPRSAAASNPDLIRIATEGDWDVYAVQSPVKIATRDGVNVDSVSWSNERIEVIANSGDGPVIVRQNWYPRWQGEVAGESVRIQRLPNGYMQVDVPPGAVTLTLKYGVTRMDWLARSLSAIGAVAVIAYLGSMRRGINTESTTPNI